MTLWLQIVKSTCRLRTTWDRAAVANEFAEPEAASSEEAEATLAATDDVASPVSVSEHEAARDEAREARIWQHDERRR